MDINVTVKIEAAPALLEVLSAAFAPKVLNITPVVEEPPKNNRSKKIPEKPAESAAPEPVKEEAKPEPALTPEAAPVSEPVPEKPKFTLEEVRGKLAALSRSGKQPAVKKLIESFEVTKLTDIPEDRYAELMEKAEAL